MLRSVLQAVEETMMLMEVNSGFVVWRQGCHWLGSPKVDAGTKCRVQDVRETLEKKREGDRIGLREKWKK